MNTSTNLKTLRMKSINYLAIPAILVFFLISGWQNSHASYSEEKVNTSYLVIETLKNTEQAIAVMRISPESAKNNIKQALALIDDIGAYYMHNTVVNVEKQGKSVIAKSYRHYYPKVDISMLNDVNQLPTLKYKLDTEILYQGNVAKEALEKNLYFDYTFAKASLKTAHEALNANHDLEAMANLRRTFEAIYLDPDFTVSTVN